MARKPDTSAIELKSATLEAMRALLRSADTAELTAALDARLGGMPGFFSGEPVVIDCGELPAGSAPDLAALRDALGRHALTAVAVQTADETTADNARLLGLAVLAADSPAPRPLPGPASRPWSAWTAVQAPTPCTPPVPPSSSTTSSTSSPHPAPISRRPHATY